MVSLYPAVDEIENSFFFELSKKAKKTSDNFIERKIANFSSILFNSLGFLAKYASYKGVWAKLTSWSFLYYPFFIIGGFSSIPFIINRIYTKYNNEIKIINKSHSWSKNVGHYNLSKISAIATAILGTFALFSTINPVIWQALLTASLILSIATVLLAEIIEKQYKSILSDKKTKGINNFEISMTRTLGFYFGESKISN